MADKANKDVHSFFAEDPEKADKAFFGRVANPDRRGFLKKTGLATMAAMVGKDGLTLLNDRPVNAETPPHLLDDAIPPTNRHFVRNNGIPPEDVDPATWTVTIDGFVDTPMTFTIAELKEQFEVVTKALTL